MKIKRGLLVGLVFSVLIISSLILISALYLDDTTAYWGNYTSANITGTLLTFTAEELSQPVHVANSPRNIHMIVNDVTGHSPGDPVYFEVYEKDSHEFGIDDAIRIAGEGEEIIGYIQNDGRTAIGNWNISLADISNSGTEADGTHEYYFKVIVGDTRSGESKTFNNVLLKVRVDWSGSFNSPDFYWLNKDLQQTTAETVDAMDLFSNGSKSTNLVFPVVNGITGSDPSGTDDYVVFQIYQYGCRIIPIRTQGSALVGDIRYNIAYAPWWISIEDIAKSIPNNDLTGGGILGSMSSTYTYIFDATIGDLGFCPAPDVPAHLLNITVDWTDFMKTIIQSWRDYPDYNIDKIEYDNSVLYKITNRKKEIELSVKTLGISKLFLLDFPTVKLDIISQKELNDSISKVVQEVRPEIVFIPFSGDINKDHKLVAESALVAVRPRPDSPVKKVFCYEVLSETEWSNPAQGAGNIFTPNYYENISDFLDDKIKAMQCYKSELKEYPHPRSLEGIKILAQKRGMEVGKRYAEAFMLVREIK